MYTMVDMKEDPEERKLDMAETCATPCDVPKGPVYPYGLRISLTHKEMTKLGMDPADAQVNGMFHMHCMVRVTSVSVNDYGDGQECRLEAQIESMCVESEDAENKAADAGDKPGKRGMKALYKD